MLAHARALLVGAFEGATDYIDADLREPDKILDAAVRTLDFGQPIGVMLLGILEFITDDAEAKAILDRLMDAVPAGSHLTIAHPTTEGPDDTMGKVLNGWNDTGATPVALRNRERFTRLFDGLEILEPGVVPLPHWRPDPDTRYADRLVLFHCAVARKP